MSAIDADPETVAAYCGIKLDRAPVDRVPLREYRETGRVVCDESGREPDPPYELVARYDTREGPTTLSSSAYAQRLADGWALDDQPARALAYHRAGWSAADLREIDVFGADSLRVDEILAEALGVVNG